MIRFERNDESEASFHDQRSPPRSDASNPSGGKPNRRQVPAGEDYPVRLVRVRQAKPESDVDLLVVMETPLHERPQRLEISRALSPRPFPMDVVVRMPSQLEERIALGNFCLREITSQGKILYELTSQFPTPVQL